LGAGSGENSQSSRRFVMRQFKEGKVHVDDAHRGKVSERERERGSARRNGTMATAVKPSSSPGEIE